MKDFINILKKRRNIEIGLMFGPEASGLSNDDLSLSNFVLQILFYKSCSTKLVVQILLSKFAHILYFRTGEAKIYQLFRHYSVCIFRSEKLLINVWISGRFSIFAQISLLFHFMPCLPTHYLAFFSI